ncbi:hypothetical protein D9M71_236850 [compost metagenome]
MRVALALQDLFHINERVVVTASARQRNGRGTLCLEVAGVVAGPDQCGVECCLIGAQVLGDAKSTLGDARVLGIDRLGHVVIQGNIETIALAGQFRRQQAVDGLLAERSIDFGLGFGGLGGLFDGRRALLWRHRQGMAALEQGKGEEQRGRSIHIGIGRLTCGQVIMTQAPRQTHN